MTATLFITILYELIYITGVEKMNTTGKIICGFIYALIALIVMITFTLYFIDRGMSVDCINAGYVYLDGNCLDVKVIEL